jgi:UMP-CMP kinase
LDYLVCQAKESKHDVFASRIGKLWEEYEEGVSPVSRIVHEVDKFQALSQAYIYSRRYPELSDQLGDFKNHREYITDPWLSGRADDILRAWEADAPHKASDTVFIFVMGGPGVGKGTQCELAAQKFGFKHVSVGELLRRERSLPGSLYGDFIEKSFRESVPVPPTLVMKLLSVELQGLGAAGRGIIVDGFPLSKDQLRAFEEEVRNRSQFQAGI